MLPNKRESVLSHDAIRLTKKLETRPINVILNTPSENISIYEVMSVTDVAINHTSSSGLEFLAAGIPVVHYDPPRLGIYPNSFGINVDRGEGLDSAVRSALSHWDSEVGIAKAINWWVTVLLRAPVDFQEQTSSPTDSLSLVLPGIARKSGMAKMFRIIVPSAFAERLSRMLQRRERLNQSPLENTTPTQKQEILSRVEGMKISDIWEPDIYIRN
jgi:hypothetical protein